MNIDYYKVLGLKPEASLNEIKTAYRKVSKKFHPDLNQDDKFFEDRFKEIQEAYEKLKDPNFKANYDRNFRNDSNTSFSQTNKNNKSNSRESTKKDTGKNPFNENHSSNQRKSNKESLNPNKIIKISVSIIIAIVLFGVIRGIINSYVKDQHISKLNSKSSISPYAINENYQSIPYSQSEIKTQDNFSAFDDTSRSIDENIFTSVYFGNISKEEIQNWLLTTLQSYSKERIYCPDGVGFVPAPCSHFDEYEFKITNDFLVVKYNYDNKYDELVYVPFYDFKVVYGNDIGSDFRILTNKNSMYEVNKSTNIKKATNYLNIGFRNNAESELIEKIEDALNTLKKFSLFPPTNDLPEFKTKSELERPSLVDTKNWILSKLNSYTMSYKNITVSNDITFQKHEEFYNFSYSINDQYLIIDYEESEFMFISTRGSEAPKYSNYSVKIPLNDFNKVELTLIRNTLRLRTANPSIININNGTKEKEIVSNVTIGFNLDAESDILDRLNKAFKTLKSYYPKEIPQKDLF